MSVWKSLMDTVADVAPSLVQAATGNPVGALLSLARKVSGGGRDESPEALAENILADPDKIMAFRAESRRLELEELKLRTQDVQHARNTLASSKGAIYVSVFVVLAFCIANILVLSFDIPSGNQNLSYLLLGNLGTGFGMVLTFWLGSSVGSKEKAQVMSQYLDAAGADRAARPVRGGQ